MTPTIRVLFFEGCPNAQPTIRLVESILARRGMTVTVEQVLVNNLDDSTRLNFLGSPSVHIDGIDIEESRRADPPFFGCRLYRHAAGTQGTPPAELIERALTNARG